MAPQNTSKIIRSVNSSKFNFTPISNELLKSTKISLEAKGLLCFILSLPENWIIYKQQVQKSLDMARFKFDRIWKECADNGYILTHKFRDGDGKFSYYYEVTDVVSTIVGKTGIGKTDIGKPNTIIKKEEEKKEEEKKDSNSIVANSIEAKKVNTNTLFSELFYSNPNISVIEYLNQ